MVPAMTDRCPDVEGDLIPAAPRPVELCEPGKPLRVVIARRSSLIYQPAVRAHGSYLEVRGKRNDPGVVPWGFWGGVLIAAVAVLFLFDVGFTRLRTLPELLLTLGLISLGGVLVRLGRRTSLKEGVICEVDSRRRELRWPTMARGTDAVLPFGEIDSLHYGIVRFVDEDRPRSDGTEAFALQVRDRSGALHPVIEASPDAEETHRMGLALAAALQVRMVYGGEGMRED